MSGRSYFDTNILVYSDDQDHPHKQAIALDLLSQHRRERKESFPAKCCKSTL